MRTRLMLAALLFVPIAAPTLAQEEPAAVVEMTSTLQFSPGTVEILVGETVEWRNVSNMQHTVTADADLAADPSFVSLPEGAEPFDSGLIDPAGTFSRTFTVAGTYDYFCIPHQGAGMRGTVVVSEAGNGNGDADEGLTDPIPEAIPLSGVQLQLSPVLEGIVAPNWGTAAPGLPNRLFVVDQPGQIHSLDLSTGQSSVFLDVSERLVELGISGPDSFDERGLLGLAFHPGYQTNGLLYTYTSEPATGEADFSTMPEDTDPNHQSVILEWQVPTPGDPASTPDAASVREVLRIDQPQFNHDAGALVFDADRFLLIALGDGGNADDEGVGHVEGGNGQATDNPLGAILRIDPLGSDSANGQYGIPTTNPFFGPQAGILPEIYAYGFRNPFRISIDPETNELWAADAGQNAIEEVDRVTAGGNYGWRLKEGSFFFDPNGEDSGFVTDEPAAEVPADLIDPVAEYDHDEGIAVVGGFVYRGTEVPDLIGRYLFGDYGTAEGGGRLFVLDENEQIQELGVAAESGFTRRILGFGRDANGELYVLANDTGTPFGESGAVLRMEAGPGTVAFDSSETSVSESAGSATVTVTRTGGGGPASVDYEVAGGTASQGSDYTLAAGTLNWADGEDGPKSITIDVTNDSADEPVETIQLALVNASGASLGSVSTATVSIEDDDQPSGGGGGGGAVGVMAAASLLGLLLLGYLGWALQRRS